MNKMRMTFDKVQTDTYSLFSQLNELQIQMSARNFDTINNKLHMQVNEQLRLIGVGLRHMYLSRDTATSTHIKLCDRQNTNSPLPAQAQLKPPPVFLVGNTMHLTFSYIKRC